MSGTTSDEWNLVSLALFAGLTAAEIDDVARLATIIVYPAGQNIFSENEPGDALYAVLRGRVEMSCRDDRGHEQILATLESGAILGEIALLTGEPRLATARTATETTVLRLTNETFKALLKQGHAAAQKILYNLARNVASHLGEMSRRLLRLMANQSLATLAPHEGELDELKRKLFVDWKF